MGDITALTGESGMTKDERELYMSFLDAIDRITNFAVCPIYTSTTTKFNEWTLKINCNSIGFVFQNLQNHHFIDYNHKCLSFYTGYEHYIARDYKYQIYKRDVRKAYENENESYFICMLSRDPLFIYEILRINEDLKLMLQKLYDNTKAELESFTEHVRALQKWIKLADKL